MEQMFAFVRCSPRISAIFDRTNRTHVKRACSREHTREFESCSAMFGIFELWPNSWRNPWYPCPLIPDANEFIGDEELRSSFERHPLGVFGIFTGDTSLETIPAPELDFGAASFR